MAGNSLDRAYKIHEIYALRPDGQTPQKFEQVGVRLRANNGHQRSVIFGGISVDDRLMLAIPAGTLLEEHLEALSRFICGGRLLDQIDDVQDCGEGNAT